PPVRRLRGRSLRRALGTVASGRPLDQPATAPICLAAALTLGGRDPSLDRPSNLALLRKLRRSRRSLPAARQLPGGSEAGARASDVADQYRALPAIRLGRARSRLAGHSVDTRPPVSTP